MALPLIIAIRALLLSVAAFQMASGWVHDLTRKGEPFNVQTIRYPKEFTSAYCHSNPTVTWHVMSRSLSYFIGQQSHAKALPTSSDESGSANETTKLSDFRQTKLLKLQVLKLASGSLLLRDLLDFNLTDDVFLLLIPNGNAKVIYIAPDAGNYLVRQTSLAYIGIARFEALRGVPLIFGGDNPFSRSILILDNLEVPKDLHEDLTDGDEFYAFLSIYQISSKQNQALAAVLISDKLRFDASDSNALMLDLNKDPVGDFRDCFTGNVLENGTVSFDKVLNALTLKNEHFGTHIGFSTKHVWRNVTASIQRPNRQKRSTFASKGPLRASKMVLPCSKIDLTSKLALNPNYTLTFSELRIWESVHGRVSFGSLLILQTGLETPRTEAFIDTEVIRELFLRRGLVAVGTDSPGFDVAAATPSSESCQGSNHYVMARQNIIAVNDIDFEALRRMPQGLAARATCVMMPLVQDDESTGSPAQIFAVIDGTAVDNVALNLKPNARQLLIFVLLQVFIIFLTAL